MDKAQLLEILHKITLFDGLESKQLSILLDMPKGYESFSSGQVMVNEGDTDSCFYIILSGSASVEVKGQTLATLGAQQFVGEVGFICNEARIATVTAKEDVIAMRLDSASFTQLPIEIREPIKDKIIAGLVSRLVKVNESLVDLKSEDLSTFSLNQTYAKSDLI